MRSPMENREKARDEVIRAARLYAQFWREDAVKTGRGLLLVEKLDELDALEAPDEKSILICTVCGFLGAAHYPGCRTRPAGHLVP